MLKLRNPANTAHQEVEPEYGRWLTRVESHAILPVKVGVFALTLFYWMWRDYFAPPSTAAFLAFFLYAAFTLAQGYFFWRDRISTAQAKPLITISYFVDLAFITYLVLLSIKETNEASRALFIGDFHIFYLLMVLRGFALFRSNRENLLIAGVMTILFVLSIIWYLMNPEVPYDEAQVIRIGIIWGILLLAMLIVNLVSKQQQESIRIRERLVRIEGLATLGELTAGVAHEINNPIGIIKAYAEYLLKASKEGDEHLDDYQTIRSEAERCETIVKRMLDFASPNVRQLEVVKPVDLIRDVFEFVFDKRRENGINAELDLPEELPDLYADSVQIKQALLNVCVNARQILENWEGAKQVTVSAKQHKGPRAPLEIVVLDTGPGIAPNDASKAFEPFYTRRKGGTGLGLAITQRIIQAHGGEIMIQPRLNRTNQTVGTECKIILPIHEKD